MASNLTIKEINSLMHKASGYEGEKKNEPFTFNETENEEEKCDSKCFCSCCCKCKCHEKPECPEIPTPITSTALSAHNSFASVIRVEERGTEIPLPSITYNRGFAPHEEFKSFTVEESGFYSIDYNIYLDRGAHLSAAVFKNGHELSGTGISPLPPADFFAGASIDFLEKGDHISLVLFGDNILVELRPKNGASLKVIRI